MRSLYDYDVLVNDVFYRCFHILLWIENNPNMSDLDREAISNTIMDALVYKKLINPEEETLDLDNLCIRKSLNYYRYQSKPFVTGIPLWMMEKYENKVIRWSGSVPASEFLSKPSGNVSFCVYDMNYVSSCIFEDFTLLDVNYDSPTRIGKRALNRPFIEVNINGSLYLIDWLTKRIFNSEKFSQRYNLEIIRKCNNKDFNKEQKEHYDEMIEEIIDVNEIAAMLLMILPFFDDENNKNSKLGQMYYYLMKAKEKYKEALDIEEMCKSIKFA